MRIIAKVITAITASIVATQAGAVELAQVNAFSCGVNPAMTSRVSMGVGSRYSEQGWKDFAASADPQMSAMVKLSMIYDKGDYVEIEHCGGTVIDSRYVVTAAHCVSGPHGEKWDKIEIHTGDARLDGPTAISRSSYDVVCHAGFEYATLTNDIALIRLREPLPRDIVPATLDDFRRPSVQQGGIALAAGWPITGAKRGAKRLQVTSLQVRDVDWPGYITVTSPTGRVEGVCRGESGGPLMGVGRDGKPTLAGVLSGIEPGTEDSTGEPCMKAGYEMYYTPIAAYRDWIDNVRNVCDHYPASCRGAGASSFFLSQAQPFGRTGTYAASYRARY